MAHECLRPEDAGRLVGLALDHPERAEAEGCSRCRMLLRSYEDFVGGESVPGARPQEAAAALGIFLRTQIEARPQRRRFPRRGALLAAAVVVTAIGISQWRPSATPPPRIERGDEGSGFAAPIIVARVGEIQLRWGEVEDADAYVVVLLAEDLTELRRFEVDGQEWTIPEVDLNGISSNGILVWQVRALRGGLELARSEMAFLEPASP